MSTNEALGRHRPPVPSGRRRRATAASLMVATAVCLTTGPTRARVVEKIVAVVGSEIILQSEVEEKAAPLLRDVTGIADPKRRAARAATLRREVLDRLIDEQLLLAQATELHINISSEEIDRTVETIKRQNNLDDDKLRAALRGQGMSMAAYRQDLKRQLLRYRVINIAVGGRVTISEEDLKSYYNRHMRSGSSVEVRASHIFISIPEDVDAAAVEERRKLAESLRDRAKTGEDFAKLAREHSDDPATRDEGGDLGTFGRDMLPKPIEELVFSLQINEVGGPVRADRGFHVLKLISKRNKEAQPFDEVKDELLVQMRQKEMERQTKGYLQDLRRKTLVDVRM